MDDALTAYREGIPDEHRPLFERLHGLITDAVPGVTLGMGYGMPLYRQGGRRLYLGTWKHGISMYGWNRADDGGFAERHPELLSGRSTIRLRPSDAAGVSDEELGVLIRNSLSS